MKQAYISTAFWDDDWIATLDPSEKLFYLYLITSPNNNLIGLYKLPLRKLCYDTGFSTETSNLLISRFQNEYKKIIYLEDHVFLKNMVKNQTLNSPKLVLGMIALVNSLSDQFKVLFLLEMKSQGIYNIFKSVQLPENYDVNTVSVRYGYPIDTLCIPYAYPIDTLCIPYAYPMHTVSIPYGTKQIQTETKTEIETETKIEKQTNNNTETASENSVCSDDVVDAVCCFKEGMSKESPRRLAALSDLTEITSQWYILRVLLNNGIKTDKLIEIYNKLPVAEIARLWFWAKIKATKNPTGYFLKLYEEDPDDVPDEIDREIMKQINELNEREPLADEKIWRIFTGRRQDELS